MESQILISLKVFLKRVQEFLRSTTFKRWVLPPAIFILVLLVSAYIVFWISNAFDTPASGGDEKVIFVSRGATFKTVSDSLENAGILNSRFTFKVAGKLLGYTTSMKVGKYVFKSGISNSELLHDLFYGTSRKLILVAIPEGIRMKSISKRFAIALGLSEEKLLALCSDSTFIRSLGLHVFGESSASDSTELVEVSAEPLSRAVPNLEGYLLPDTYSFHWQPEEREIISSMVEAFKTFYADSLFARQRELKMSLNQVLTFASIVEGETRLDNERAIIAGVYHNRLKKRMRLEADPTVQYALPDGPRRLLYQDLKVESPYNTYKNFGLPPGPINNPGRLSILATLYPDDHGYLFFVADGQGGHWFSKSYNEHLRNVNSFRRVRREIQKQLNGG